jgi:carbamoyl-phosphate synthase large subunit
VNILISGIASDIGFGVGRIMRAWGWVGLFYGIDIQKWHAGEFLFDQCDVAPPAKDPAYIDWIIRYIKQYNIGLFIPTSEAEIGILSKRGLREIGGAKVLISNEKAISNSLDKKACMAYLSKYGIHVPENGEVGVNAPKGYPVIVKPRAGQGSKDIRRIETIKSFEESAPIGYIWQEYLFPEDQEFTCAIYKSELNDTQVLLLRRVLSGGLTARGEVIKDTVIESYVRAIASVLELNGVINVQLRLTRDGPRLFEINPRLSSTLVFRDKMGFSDLRWWVRDTVGQDYAPKIQQYKPPPIGTRFYRGTHEYITAKSQSY